MRDLDGDCAISDEDLATLLANLASILHPDDPGAAEDSAMRLVDRIILAPRPALV